MPNPKNDDARDLKIQNVLTRIPEQTVFVTEVFIEDADGELVSLEEAFDQMICAGHDSLEKAQICLESNRKQLIDQFKPHKKAGCHLYHAITKITKTIVEMN